MLAGVAIDTGGTGIAHAIGHGLGTLAHVPHGVAVAVGLAAAVRVERRRWPAWRTGRSRPPWAARSTEVPARFDELVAECRLGDAVAAIGPLDGRGRRAGGRR